VTSSLDGPSATRVFLVEGLGGAPETRLSDVITLSGIPQVGTSYHPGDPTLPATSVTVTPVESSPSQAIVTIAYGRRGDGGPGGTLPDDRYAEASIDVVSSVHATTTNKYYLGSNIEADEPIKVWWSKDATEEGDPVKWYEQLGTVELQQPTHAVIFRRREHVSPGVPHPKGWRQASTAYVGHTNSREFLGDAARVWLCTRMDGSSEDQGATYTVTYEFQRRYPDWDAHVVAQKMDTGELEHAPGLPGQPSSGDFQIYPTANFTELRLYLP
jgi:hypothetical protein